MDWQPVISFWFEQTEPQDHWRKSEAFDRHIVQRFGATHGAAAQCDLWHWRATPLGRLAEILVLDQFSRHIYRDRPESFASDPLALALAQEAVAAGVADELEPARRAFLYMPFMHSESYRMHEHALRLFAEPGLENNLRFEQRHKAIIDQFGRYPHRNGILGRTSTPAELRFLQQPGSSF